MKIKKLLLSCNLVITLLFLSILLLPWAAGSVLASTKQQNRHDQASLLRMGKNENTNLDVLSLRNAFSQGRKRSESDVTTPFGPLVPQLHQYDFALDKHVSGQENEVVQLLVSFNNGLDWSALKKSKKAAETATKHSLGAYVGQNTYIIKAHLSDIEKLQQVEGVTFVGHYKPQHKFDPESFKRFRSGDKTKLLSVDAKEELLAQLRDEAEEKLGRGSGKHEQSVMLIEVLLESSISAASTGEHDVHASRIASQIKDELERASVEVKHVGVASKKKIIFSVPQSAAVDAANIISQNSYVHWIEPRSSAQLYNTFARWITQSGQQDHVPMSNHGLNGEGQIVAIGDSGVDTYSCFFHDHNNSVPFFTHPSNRSEEIANNSKHRKILGYYSFMDGLDYDGGHGTHVAGSLTGDPLPSASFLSNYKGMAPKSKLFVTDLGCSSPFGCSCPFGIDCDCNYQPHGMCKALPGSVAIPTDLEENYFSVAYESGARIHSSSWGSGIGMGYSSSTREIDSFAWNHKDFLIIFAAGNAGNTAGYSSIASQGEAKNAITVGASMSPVESFLHSAEHFTNWTMMATSVQQILMGAINCLPGLVASHPDYELCEFIKDFTPDKCCMTTGLCAPSSSRKNNTRSCGCYIKEIFVGAYCCAKCDMEAISNPANAHHYGIENLASFGSRGPAADGRIKPDIVAPGNNIFSALSHGSVPEKSCSALPTDDLTQHISIRDGTSMAAPVVAGAAALVRQYFMVGYYPSGLRRHHDAFTPSSALIKAVLINSARPLQGYVDMGKKLGGWIRVQSDANSAYTLNPLSLSGFGRIDLDNTLTFLNNDNDDDDNSQHTLFIARRQITSSTDQQQQHGDPELSTGERHTYCFKAKKPKKSNNGNGNDNNNGTPFRATLVWTDYPSSPAARRALVNNLDLGVKSCCDNRGYFWGNIMDPQINARDYINNVELVTLPELMDGHDYIVIVEGSHVPHGPQPYALVITGDIEMQSTCNMSLFEEEKKKEELSASDTTSNVDGGGGGGHGHFDDDDDDDDEISTDTSEATNGNGNGNGNSNSDSGAYMDDGHHQHHHQHHYGASGLEIAIAIIVAMVFVVIASIMVAMRKHFQQGDEPGSNSNSNDGNLVASSGSPPQQRYFELVSEPLSPVESGRTTAEEE